MDTPKTESSLWTRYRHVYVVFGWYVFAFLWGFVLIYSAVVHHDGDTQRMVIARVFISPFEALIWALVLPLPLALLSLPFGRRVEALKRPSLRALVVTFLVALGLALVLGFI